jgi:hypothetical protein
MNRNIRATTTLIIALARLTAVAIVACFVLIVNYLMISKALALFFERDSVLGDRFVGPLARSLGLGQATLSELFAILITVVATMGLAGLAHWYRELRDRRFQLRLARDRGMSDLVPEVERQLGESRRALALRFPPILAVILMDGVLFTTRLAMLVFPGYEEIGEIPSLLTLLEAERGSMVPMLLIGMLLGYLAIPFVMAFALERGWTGVAVAWDNWLNPAAHAATTVPRMMPAPSAAARPAAIPSAAGGGPSGTGAGGSAPRTPGTAPIPTGLAGAPAARGERVRCPACTAELPRAFLEVYGHIGCPANGNPEARGKEKQ